jgi:hypothetical protein
MIEVKIVPDCSRPNLIVDQRFPEVHQPIYAYQRTYEPEKWVIFSDEVSEWMHENIRYNARIVNRYSRYWAVEFEDDAEAILFKMRWL